MMLHALKQFTVRGAVKIHVHLVKQLLCQFSLIETGLSIGARHYPVGQGFG